MSRPDCKRLDTYAILGYNQEKGVQVSPGQKLRSGFGFVLCSPDQVAARIVGEYDAQVRLLKAATNTPQNASIPDSIVLAKFSTAADHRRLLTLGSSPAGEMMPWQSPNIPSPHGNYCAHFYAMRPDLSLPLFVSSLKLGVNYNAPANRGPLGPGQTPLQIAGRLHHDEPELIRAMAEAVAASPPVPGWIAPVATERAPAQIAPLPVHPPVRSFQARLPFG